MRDRAGQVACRQEQLTQGLLYHQGTLSPANLQSHPVLHPQGSVACAGEECAELTLLPLMIPGVVKADPATEVVPFSLRSQGTRKWRKPGYMEQTPRPRTSGQTAELQKLLQRPPGTPGLPSEEALHQRHLPRAAARCSGCTPQAGVASPLGGQPERTWAGPQTPASHHLIAISRREG